MNKFLYIAKIYSQDVIKSGEETLILNSLICETQQEALDYIRDVSGGKGKIFKLRIENITFLNIDDDEDKERNTPLVTTFICDLLEENEDESS